MLLTRRPNRKNDGRLSTENSQDDVETNERNAMEMTTFVQAFVREGGKTQSANGTCYLELLQEIVWSTFTYRAARMSYWWMQNGAPPHCTALAKGFLLEKFRGRVISRGTAINWLVLSPDLNPLEFHF